MLMKALSDPGHGTSDQLEGCRRLLKENLLELVTFASCLHQISCFHVISTDYVIFMETHALCTEGRGSVCDTHA